MWIYPHFIVDITNGRVTVPEENRDPKTFLSKAKTKGFTQVLAQTTSIGLWLICAHNFRLNARAQKEKKGNALPLTTYTTDTSHMLKSKPILAHRLVTTRSKRYTSIVATV